jgi:hypothetical protein
MLLTCAGRGAIGALLFSLVIIIAPSFAQAQVDLSNPSGQASSSAQEIISAPALDPHNSADVEAAVRSYFADIPVMIAIADCESGFTQLNSSGAALNGGSGGMIGVFQVNRSVHAKFALTLGDDINTLTGNMAYARYLYNNEGTVPWNSSKSCWSPIVSSGSLPAAALSKAVDIVEAVVLPSAAKASAQVVDTPAAVPAAQNATQSLSQNLNQNLKLGTVSAQVATLQKLLNKAGYAVAKTGPGSVSNETDTFGVMTKAAVQRFQCAQNIVCKGTEATTGYGLVGAKTRAALMLN